MEITGEYRIAAPREAVWQGLNDPDILRQSIPGCETLDKVSDSQFSGAVTAKVGPVKAKFQGSVTLSELDPPKSYVLSGEGKGAAAGFAKGSAKVELEEDGEETILRYNVNAQVGGKLAQIGARLIDGTVKKLSAEFFQKFSDLLTAQSEATQTTPPKADVVPETAIECAPEEQTVSPPPVAEQKSADASGAGLHPAVWVVGVIVIVGVLLWIFAGN
jgi:uncharacterized protein